jgi:hypothetical protein
MEKLFSTRKPALHTCWQHSVLVRHPEGPKTASNLTVPLPLSTDILSYRVKLMIDKNWHIRYILTKISNHYFYDIFKC